MISTAAIPICTLNYSTCVRVYGSLLAFVASPLSIPGTGAQFVFRTGFEGEADMAQGLLELAQAGCQIIVDDLRYSEEVGGGQCPLATAAGYGI